MNSTEHRPDRQSSPGTESGFSRESDASGSRVFAFARRTLLLAVFFAFFSLPAGRGFLVLSLVALIVFAVRARRSMPFPTVAWLALLFIVETALVTVLGVNPEDGVGKLDKLFWFSGIIPAASLLTTGADRRRMLMAAAAGAVVCGLITCFSRLRIIADTLRSGDSPDWMKVLTDGTSMTDAQRLMVGLIAIVGLLVWKLRNHEKARAGLWLALAPVAGGLLLCFKRGSWISAVFCILLMAAASLKKRYLLVPVLVIVLCAFLPPVSARLLALKKEFNPDAGGRVTMWVKVAPELIRTYPMGIGYRSLTNEMMKEIAPRVESRRDHLHSNPVQILVATGWLGLAFYMAWMGCGLADGWRYRSWALRSGDDEDGHWALVLLLMFIGLLVNGLVEYNFGDGELVLLYGFLMGACAAGRQAVRASRQDVNL